MSQSKITKSARDEDCALRIPGICNFDPETTVFCHAPCVDKGMGIKSPDWFGVFGCSSCHDFVDRRRSPAEYNQIVGDYGIESIWMPAIFETQKKLISKGLILIV